MKKIVIVILMSLGLLISGNIFADTDTEGNTPAKHHHHKKHKPNKGKKDAASTCWSCINH